MGKVVKAASYFFALICICLYCLKFVKELEGASKNFKSMQETFFVHRNINS